jgi:acid phosphatase type 7
MIRCGRRKRHRPPVPSSNGRTLFSSPALLGRQIAKLVWAVTIIQTVGTSRRTAQNGFFVHGEKINARYCNGQIRHVRIAFGNDPTTEMIISFATVMSYYPFVPIGGVLVGRATNNDNGMIDEELVEFESLFIEQENASSYSIPVARKNQGNYQMGDDDDNVSEYRSPYYHHITIRGLEPNTTYHYRPVVHANLRSFASEPAMMVYGNDNDSNDHNDMMDYQEPDQAGTRRQRQRRMDEPPQEHTHNSTNGGMVVTPLRAYDGTMKACPSTKKIRTFRTAPNVTAQSKVGIESTFAIIGDLGQYEHSEATLASVLQYATTIDAIILAGDIAYSRQDHRQWDTFLDFLDDYPVAERLPMMIVPGNHDIDKTKTSRDIFLAYERRFRMPRVRPPKLGLYDGGADVALNMDAPPYPLPYEWGNAYYAWTYGLVRMVMVNAYASMEPNSVQYKWLVEELSAVDRHRTPWLTVVIHVPIYNTFGVHRHDLQIMAAREHLEPLFVKYGVNVIFSGHIHAYSRTAPVENGRVSETGPIHIVVGAGGRKCEAAFLDETPEPYMRVRDATFFGYGLFRVHNATVAAWEWIHTGLANDRDNHVYHSNQTLPSGPRTDEVTIVNYHYRGGTS